MTITRRLKPEEIFPVCDYLWANWPNKESIPTGMRIIPEHLAQSWVKLMGIGAANGYGLFRSNRPAAVLLGMFVPDLHNGEMQGVECLWAGKQSQTLLDLFEKDCHERKCARIVCGLHLKVFGSRAAAMRRLYERRGYQVYSESFVKSI